jgi:hypothetical protein
MMKCAPRVPGYGERGWVKVMDNFVFVLDGETLLPLAEPADVRSLASEATLQRGR